MLAFDLYSRNGRIGPPGGREGRTLVILAGLVNPLAGAGLGEAAFILILFPAGSETFVVLLPAAGAIILLGLAGFFAPPTEAPAVPTPPIPPTEAPAEAATLFTKLKAAGLKNIPLPISHSK